MKSTIRPCSVLMAICSVVALLAAPSGSALATTVNIPIPSIRIIENTCSIWTIDLTYTATPVDSSLIGVLMNYGSWSNNSHYHADNGSYDGRWVTSNNFRTHTAEERLQEINVSVFGRPDPAAGASIHGKVSHNGACAADLGRRECVGIFVATGAASEHYTPGTEPPTFPFGMCSGVPPALVSCSFDTSVLPIDLGYGTVGARVGKGVVSVTCSRPTKLRIAVTDWANDTNGSTLDKISIDGQSLPYVGSNPGGSVGLPVEVSVTAQRPGRISLTRVLNVSIP